MAVYVDDMYKIELGKFRHMNMSHLVADSTEELLSFVDKIGVQRKWIQYPGKNTEHFDICISKRKLAIQMGAIAVGMRELARATLGRENCNQKLNICPSTNADTTNQGSITLFN